MAIQNPPITEQPALDFTLLEMVKLVNELEQQNIQLIKDIKEATNLSLIHISEPTRPY